MTPDTTVPYYIAYGGVAVLYLAYVLHLVRAARAARRRLDQLGQP